MDPQFVFLSGENRFRDRIRERQRRMETAANSGEMRNIMVAVPTRPTRLVCQEK